MDGYKVNVFAVASLTQTALPYFVKNSHVVTISSMGGIQGSMKFAGLAAYSSSKGAVINFAELLAEEYREKGFILTYLPLERCKQKCLQKLFPTIKLR